MPVQRVPGNAALAGCLADRPARHAVDARRVLAGRRRSLPIGTKVLLNADFRTLYADLGRGRAGGMAMLPAAIAEEP